MSIISQSYFKGSLRIANVLDSAPNYNVVGNYSKVGIDITKYEREVLINLLGYALYKEFKSKFDVDALTGVWTLKIAENGSKWDDLLNGKEYTLNGVTHYWRGLIYTDSDITGAPKDASLIAYYVYYCFLMDEEITHSGIGMQTEKAQGADRISSKSKAVWAYNSFVDHVTVSKNYERCLYDFINDMNNVDSATYEDWDYTQFNYENRYGV